MQNIRDHRFAFFSKRISLGVSISKEQIAAMLVVVLAIIAIRLPIDYKRIMTITDNDYTFHIYYALDMLGQRPVTAFTWAHPLWELTLVFIWWLSRCRIDFWQSAIGIQVLSSVAAGLLVYFWYGSLPNRPGPWIRAFWAVTLVMVTPVSLPTLIDGSYYFGYIGLADYHSPTTHVLRPFAVLLFIFAFEALHSRRAPFWKVLISALALIAATLFKPNLTITLIPTVGVLVLYRMIRRKPFDWNLSVFGLGLPAVIVLGVQYFITFVGGDPGAKIVFMPLAVARSMSSYIAIKFFLSILFPLTVSVAFFNRIRHDPEMGLAWLAFGVGAAQYFLLAELPGLTHANFLWGAQITLFILFSATGRFILKQDFSHKPWTNRKAWIAYLAYLPHILAGIAYYIFCYITPHYG